MSRVLSWIAAALVGGVYGIAGTISHSVMWGPIPIGMIVAAIACAAILIAVRALTHDRGAAVAAGLGMIGMLVLISGEGPEDPSWFRPRSPDRSGPIWSPESCCWSSRGRPFGVFPFAPRGQPRRNPSPASRRLRG